MAPPKLQRLGGTLTLGAVPLDVSSQVIGVNVGSELSLGDPLTVLTGDTVASGMTTEDTLSGTMLIDPSAGGVTEWTWQNHGTVQPFTLTVKSPTQAEGIEVSGTVLISRLNIGGEAFGEVLQAEFEWAIASLDEPVFPAAAP